MDDALLDRLIDRRRPLAERLRRLRRIAARDRLAQAAQRRAEARRIHLVGRGPLLGLAGALQRRNMVCHLLLSSSLFSGSSWSESIATPPWGLALSNDSIYRIRAAGHGSNLQLLATLSPPRPCVATSPLPCTTLAHLIRIDWIPTASPAASSAHPPPYSPPQPRCPLREQLH